MQREANLLPDLRAASAAHLIHVTKLKFDLQNDFKSPEFVRV
jgi:hypothetical protein